MRGAPAVRANILHMLPQVLAPAGVDAGLVLARAGLSAEAVATARPVPRAQVCAALHAAARALGDGTVGLRLGRQAEAGRLGRMGLSLTSGQTLADSLAAHAATMPEFQTHVRLSVRAQGDTAVWTHVLGDAREDHAWLLYEGATAFMLQVLGQALGPAWRPQLVSFPHACRGRAGDYERAIGAPVRFGTGDGAEILFARRLLAAPVVASTPAADDLPPDPPEPLPRGGLALDGTDLADAVARMVRACEPGALARLSDVARRLALPPRTLQRRLAEAGSTFGELADAARREAALVALRAGDQSVTSLGLALGYSDTAHFTRAVRRWTGAPPSVLRRGDGAGTD